MKKKQFLFLGILSILLSACGTHYSSNDIIIEAESVLNEYPDSAFQLLSSIPQPRSRRFVIGVLFVRTRNYLHFQSNAQVTNLRERAKRLEIQLIRLQV